MNIRSLFTPTFLKKLSPLYALPALLLTASCQAQTEPAPSWNGPTFREFSGTNHTSASANLSLYGNALSWDRRDIIWATVEPKRGQWNQERLTAWGDHLLKMRAAGAEVLPVLVYTAPWAADRGARTWQNGKTKWEAKPRPDGKVDVLSHTLQADGTWLPGKTRLFSDFDKFPPANIEDWKNYVTKVVTFLRQPPYNVKYFQVWNEAYPTSGFWYGNLDDYIQKIHLPAAQVIRSLGGKVVYGGWPSVTDVNPLVQLLDRNKAWDSIDVIDCHYQLAIQLETLRRAADARGYPHMAIWETEMGYSGTKLFVPDQYPRLLHWALSNKWDTPQKYLMMYYAHEVPDNPANPEYGRNLWTGANLSYHGQNLQALANLLDGGKLGLLPGVTSTPSLTPQRDNKIGSLEAFTVANRVVIAAHTRAEMYGNTPNLVLELPLQREQIAKAERVDILGNRQDITQVLTATNTGTRLTAAVQDAPGSQAKEWNDTSKSGCKVFYVVLTKNSP